MSSYYFHKNIFWFQNNKKTKKTYFIEICNAILKWKCRIVKFDTYHTYSQVKFPNKICVLWMFTNHFSWWWFDDNVIILICPLLISFQTWYSKFLQFMNAWPGIPSWYSHFSFGLYHLENDGCKGSNKNILDVLKMMVSIFLMVKVYHFFTKVWEK